jgi:5'-nucleotidase (lipoprotein e(P4) family)
MDDLEAIFNNLAVGATIIVAVLGAAWLRHRMVGGNERHPWWEKYVKNFDPLKGRGLLVLLLAYGAGHGFVSLSETLYSKFGDNAPFDFVGSKTELRRSEFLSGTLASDALSRNIPMSKEVRSEIDGCRSGTSTASCHCRHRDDRAPACLEIDRIYYDAKNWCYRQNHYVDELLQSERWLCLVRSFFLLGLGGIAFGVVLLGVFIWKSLSLVASKPVQPSPKDANPGAASVASFRDHQLKQAMPSLALVTAGLLIVGASVLVHLSESSRYYRRIYGYWLSDHGESAHGSQVMLHRSDSLLWLETSAEYRAVALSTFNDATTNLDKALRDPTWTALPQQRDNLHLRTLKAAVILDVDETIVLNMRYQAELAAANEEYSASSFDAWARRAAGEAVPGAREFLSYAKSRDVDIFYLTNRDKAYDVSTRENLRHLGYPVTDMGLLSLSEAERLNDTDKSSRRDMVATKHRVVLVLGDDIKDFMSVKDAPWPDRRERIDEFREYWGTKWFILPNPVYGSWEEALFGRGLTTVDAVSARECAIRQLAAGKAPSSCR